MFRNVLLSYFPPKKQWCNDCDDWGLFKYSWSRVWAASFLSCRLVTNKLLLGVIIVMELAILGAVIYLKFFRKWENFAISYGSGTNSDSLSVSTDCPIAIIITLSCCFQSGVSVRAMKATERRFCPSAGEAHLTQVEICQPVIGPNLQLFEALWTKICTVA